MIIGATGFIGRALLAELQDRGVPAKGVARGHRTPLPPGTVCADLTVPESLGGLISPGDTVIHAAPYLGGDATLSERINVQGTRNLINAAERAGASQLIYLSTTAVYGMGPHRNATTDTPIKPTTSRSRHRRRAEEIILDAGGCVVRPHLIYGHGDTWVIPALLALPGIIGGLVNGGQALTSLIAVEDLARLLATLSTQPPADLAGGIFHAAHPTPLTVGAFTTEVAKALDVQLQTTPVPPLQALEAATAAGFSPHQLDLAATDHWYDADALWGLTASPASPPRPALSAQHLQWYRQLLAKPDAGPRL